MPFHAGAGSRLRPPSRLAPSSPGGSGCRLVSTLRASGARRGGRCAQSWTWTLSRPSPRTDPPRGLRLDDDLRALRAAAGTAAEQDLVRGELAIAADAPGAGDPHRHTRRGKGRPTRGRHSGRPLGLARVLPAVLASQAALPACQEPRCVGDVSPGPQLLLEVLCGPGRGPAGIRLPDIEASLESGHVVGVLSLRARGGCLRRRNSVTDAGFYGERVSYGGYVT